jgi:hypothetical protein
MMTHLYGHFLIEFVEKSYQPLLAKATKLCAHECGDFWLLHPKEPCGLLLAILPLSQNFHYLHTQTGADIEFIGVV